LDINKILLPARTLVRVVERVEHQGLERRVHVALRRGDARDDGLEHLRDAGAVLGRDGQGLVAVEGEDLGDLVPGGLDVGGGQVDLVDDRDDLEAAVERQIEVGQRLGLDALGRVHDQQRAFAGGQGARDLVGEVHVPRRVDQVQRVLLPVLGPVEQPDGVGLDRDAALLLQVHRVEHLVHRLLGVHGAGQRQETVGQRGFAVVDVGDDGEIADQLDGHPAKNTTALRGPRALVALTTRGVAAGRLELCLNSRGTAHRR
jgi:hypothetical protein